MNAGLIVLDINTPGGRVDTAEALGTLIKDSPIETVAFVRGDAASAGSFLALNADKIVMSPGSMIGAAAIGVLNVLSTMNNNSCCFDHFATAVISVEHGRSPAGWASRAAALREAAQALAGAAAPLQTEAAALQQAAVGAQQRRMEAAAAQEAGRAGLAQAERKLAESEAIAAATGDSVCVWTSGTSVSCGMAT